MHERIMKFEEVLEKDLKEELDKVNNAGTVTPEGMKTIDCAVDLMLKLNEYKEYMFGNENSYNRGYSNRRGRSATTGRYVSRDYAPDHSYERMNPYERAYDRYNANYSGHSMKDRLIADLESKYDSAQSEHERQFLDSWIKRIEMDK